MCLKVWLYKCSVGLSITLSNMFLALGFKPHKIGFGDILDDFKGNIAFFLSYC